MRLGDFVEAHVGLETLRHEDAVGSLVVFEEGGDDTRKGEGAAVEGVGQTHFAVGVFEAEFHAIGLEGLEIGDGADFEPTLLCGAPHFEVEGHGGGEADVATAQFEDAVGEAEFVEEAADMSFHLLELVVAAVGVFDDDDFDFAEFVETVEPADVFAVAACFTAEAFAIAHVLDGELVGIDDDVAIDVGDGHFGCGDHVEAVERDGIHLTLLVGELTGAEAGGFVDHERRLDFEVACIGSAVEEEVDECALQTGTFAFIDRETGAGDFVAQFEIDEVIFGAEVPVGQCVGGQVGHGAEASHFEVVFGRASLRDGEMGSVGEGDEFGVELRFDVDHLVGELFFVGFELSGASFLLFSFIAFALFEEQTDFFGDSVLFGFEVVGLFLEGAALFVEGDDFVDTLFDIVDVFYLKTLDAFVAVLFDVLDLKHDVWVWGI